MLRDTHAHCVRLNNRERLVNESGNRKVKMLRFLIAGSHLLKPSYCCLLSDETDCFAAHSMWNRAIRKLSQAVPYLPTPGNTSTRVIVITCSINPNSTPNNNYIQLYYNYCTQMFLKKI